VAINDRAATGEQEGEEIDGCIDASCCEWAGGGRGRDSNSDLIGARTSKESAERHLPLTTSPLAGHLAPSAESSDGNFRVFGGAVIGFLGSCRHACSRIMGEMVSTRIDSLMVEVG
jgi:hypothetical protein